jgi:hypothetical protein
LAGDGASIAPVRNPLVILDGLDDRLQFMCRTERDALMALLDDSVLSEFMDEFFSVPVDVSNVSVLAVAESVEGIPKEILDRFRVISLREYTEKEVADVVIPSAFSDWWVKEEIRECTEKPYIRQELRKRMSKEIKGTLRGLQAFFPALALHQVGLGKEPFVCEASNDDVSWEDFGVESIKGAGIMTALGYKARRVAGLVLIFLSPVVAWEALQSDIFHAPKTAVAAVMENFLGTPGDMASGLGDMK